MRSRTPLPPQRRAVPARVQVRALRGPTFRPSGPKPPLGAETGRKP